MFIIVKFNEKFLFYKNNRVGQDGLWILRSTDPDKPVGNANSVPAWPKSLLLRDATLRNNLWMKMGG